jgi:hypothetical protein
MKLTDRTDLSPETIALYQRLERGRHQPKITKAGKVLAVSFAVMTLWPVVFFRFPRFFLVLLFSGMLVGLSQAWRDPLLWVGVGLTPVAAAANWAYGDKLRKPALR